MNEKERNFKIALAKAKMTQAELAKKVGVSTATVSNFVDTLKNGKPQPATAQKYAEALGIEVEKIL